MRIANSLEAFSMNFLKENMIDKLLKYWEDSSDSNLQLAAHGIIILKNNF